MDSKLMKEINLGYRGYEVPFWIDKHDIEGYMNSLILPDEQMYEKALINKINRLTTEYEKNKIMKIDTELFEYIFRKYPQYILRILQSDSYFGCSTYYGVDFEGTVIMPGGFFNGRVWKRYASSRSSFELRELYKDIYYIPIKNYREYSRDYSRTYYTAVLDVDQMRADRIILLYQKV